MTKRATRTKVKDVLKEMEPKPTKVTSPTTIEEIIERMKGKRERERRRGEQK